MIRLTKLGLTLIVFSLFISLGATVVAAERDCADLLTLRDARSALREALETKAHSPLKAHELKTLSKMISQKFAGEILALLSVAPRAADGRVHTRIFKNEALSVFAIRWENNGTTIHNHNGSETGIYVLKGTMTEEIYYPPNPTPAIRTLHEGEAYALNDGHTHRVSGQDAVSVHFYSMPLNNMTYFEIRDGNVLTQSGSWVDDEP